MSNRFLIQSGPAPLRIALVEDDESLSRSVGRLLRASGAQTQAYATAEAFLQDPARLAFDCLVLDVQLGGMTGLELQRRLREAGEQTPVVFLTGQIEPEIREQAHADGCVAFVRKTDPDLTLLTTIRHAIAA